jgi:hypothetical protein
MGWGMQAGLCDDGPLPTRRRGPERRLPTGSANRLVGLGGIAAEADPLRPSGAAVADEGTSDEVGDAWDQNAGGGEAASPSSGPIATMSAQ